MKKVINYIPSLILSVVLVFALLGTSMLCVAKSSLTADNCVQLAHQNNMGTIILSELEKYYKEKYNTSGVPADVYINALDEDYIYSVTESYINALFDYINDGTAINVTVPENQKLEESIESFYSDYAESIDYEKDEAYEKKLADAKSNAYKIIGNYCDVYKSSALANHGVLNKVRVFWSGDKPNTYVMCAIIACCVILLLIFLVNFKEAKVFLYWTGISAVISGLFGLLPCVYLLKTNYFSAFSIKQASIFTTFTSSLTGITQIFLKTELAFVIVGILLIVIYSVIPSKNKAEKPVES